MTQRITLLLLFFSLIPAMLMAQNREKEKEKTPFKDRLVFGGDIILNFSNIQTAVGGSPMVGYKVSDSYIAGLGYTYVYVSSDASSLSYHGPRVFNRFFPIPEAFAHAELEYMTYTTTLDIPGEDERKVTRNFPALLVGGGYRQELASGVFLSFTVLFDVIEDPDSYYNGPIFRGGIGVGF